MSRAHDTPLLVTGASGFLGRHLLQALQPRPSIALVRSEEAWRAQDWTGKIGPLDTVEGSVLEPDAWQDDPRLARLRGIVHLAAEVKHSRRDTAALERTNVEGTRAMVRLAAERGCRLVFVSTSGTVGCFEDPEARADEEAPFCEETVARWPYYRSKIRAEREARRLADELGAELVVVRPPILLGPGDHRLRSTSNLLRFLRGKLPFVIRGGIAFVDVRDVAAALVQLTERPAVQPVYHLPGTACSVEAFFRMAEEVSGVPAPRWVLPYRPAWLLASGLAALRVHLLPDPVVVEMAAHHWGVASRHAEAELGFRPRDPHETLRDSIDWLREHVLDAPPRLAGQAGPRSAT
jgi:nucleoside-diphosphate-sugar epimerase